MKFSVSQFLSEKHGVNVRPGAKIQCPRCPHTTFSIKSDDSLGKCFHPSCGYFVNAAQKTRKHLYLSNIMKNIFLDFHKSLMSMKNKDNKNAHTYLIKERKIHPRVVVDSMLGAVPYNYDLDEKFVDLIREAKTNAELEKNNKKGTKGAQKKNKTYSSQESLDFLLETKEKLKKCIFGRTGWLCFFYQDSSFNIVAIRFRRPYMHQFYYFKPYKNIAGVFGHGLFTPFQSSLSKKLNDFLIVTEGEFNQLQLQSLCYRYSEATGSDPNYVFACAVGGVGNADFETIRKIARCPVVCYDNDKTGAGFSLVEKAREFMNISAFTTPALGSDLDNFILSFDSKPTDAWNTFKNLIDKRKLYPRDFKSLASEVFSIRQKRDRYDKRREFEINAEVADIVLNDLRERGKFYNDGHRSFFFFELEKKLIEVNHDSDEIQLLLSQYGINRSESIYRYLVEAIRMEALMNGTKTEIYKFGHYNSETFTLYLFNHKNQIYCISPNKIDFVDNGSDGVLFLTDSNAQPFEMVEYDSEISLIDEIITSKINFASGILSQEERRSIFDIWLRSLFFHKELPTKPILAFIGEKGSGKSIALRKVGMLLFGEKFNVVPLPEDPKDFDAAVTNSSFVAFDNADSKSRWLNDRLAILATGGVIKKRELYTTNKLIEIPTCCFVAITSRTPNFRRDDVVDRLLVMRVERFKNFISERTLLDEVIHNRDRLMTELIHRLQESVGALSRQIESDDFGDFRMADFANFAIKIAQHIGKGQEMKAIFKKLSQEQSLFSLEDEPIVDLLFKWTMDNSSEREITNTELCKELSDIADEEKIEFPYNGKPRAFAQRMSNIRINLEEYFFITTRPAGARKNYFTFSPKKEGNSK